MSQICFHSAPSVAPATMDQQEVLQEAELGDAIVTWEISEITDRQRSPGRSVASLSDLPTSSTERGTDIERLQTCPNVIHVM